MSPNLSDQAVGLILVGAIVLASIVVRSLLTRLKLPAVVGYILIGAALAAALGSGSGKGSLLPASVREALDLLAELGLVALLFRVGLESDLAALLRALRRASVVFLSNFLVSGLAGMTVVFLVTDGGLIPALFAGAALSATSVGVSTAVWRDSGALKSDAGALLVDVAELDDIAAVMVIAFLFALAPALQAGGGRAETTLVLREAAWMIGKLALLVGGSMVFARRLERRMTRWFKRQDKRLGDVLFAFGVALLLAAVAEILQFSAAIGAMLAGLVFSRDPREARIDRAFEQVYVLFVPFFFLSVGLAVDWHAMAGAPALAAWLIGAAVIGKLVGAGVPVWLLQGRQDAQLIAWSMVPRAEIALIVVSYGLAKGDWAVPPSLYGAVVATSLVTCLIGPVQVQRLLARRAGTRRSTR